MFIPASLSFASDSTLLVFGPGARDASEGFTLKDEERCTDCANDRGLDNFWLAEGVCSDDLSIMACLAQILSVLGGFKTCGEAREPLEARRGNVGVEAEAHRWYYRRRCAGKEEVEDNPRYARRTWIEGQLYLYICMGRYLIYSLSKPTLVASLSPT